VREVARMFESAGVARTERSITNWCQPNRSGIARLDAYFDPNERKYFIAAKSVKQAIEEEKTKTAKGGELSEPAGSIPNDAEDVLKGRESEPEIDTASVRALEQKIFDLSIMNSGKDYFIEQLQKEREGFAQERQGYVEKLMSFNRKVGELETKLLQLEAPKEPADGPIAEME
jgi:hypothetical protein